MKGYIGECNLYKRGKYMDLNKLTLFKMVDVERSYLSERQKVLAANVANANTPGFLPKDVTKPDFSREIEKLTANKQKLKLTMTDEHHLSGLPEKDNGQGGLVYIPKPTNPLSIDGNGVVLEDQLNEVSKNKGDYNRMITIYSSFKGMLQTANTKINS